MKIKCIPIAYLLLLLLHGCSHSKKVQAVITQNPPDTLTHNKMIETDPAKTDSFFVGLLQQYPQYFEAILKNRKDWNVQIIYTEINRDKNNNPKFRDYYFNVDASKYFYPASTVKLPVALLALQKLHELRNTGITRSTSMITEAAYSGQVATYNDPQTPDGRPTLESYIKRIFLVSDNEAFNRIYEFLGQQYINEQLHKRGYTDAQIIHRLDVFLSEDENRHTNPVKFLDNNNKILYSQPLVFNEVPYPERHDSLGRAYYSEGKLINMPMNFSKKNRLSLEDLHQILRSVIFPNALPENQRFDLTDSDYAFLHQYMSQFPGETIYPSYDSVNYPDAYAKFLLYGSQKGSVPKNVRIFNKVGDAYGQLIDIAYITDLDKNIEFFLSATINCDRDGVLNDDAYSYDSVGFPFMKNLGQVMYDYELKRTRTFQPDLSPFKIRYDK